METIKRILFVIVLSGLFIFTNACKKDETKRLTDLLYELEIDGNEAKFTVVTAGLSDYSWDFGDGATSNEANPSHIYPGKGKYVATLSAKVNGAPAEASTVIRIAKTSPVKIDDNSLADWDNVSQNVINSGPSGGIFRKVKFDYDGNTIYVYMEMKSTKANADIFDFYIDSDNSSSTGLLSGFPGGGYDILLEGQLLTAGLDVFYHVGEQASFSFEQQSISDFIEVGTIKQDNDILKFETKIARSKLKGLTGEAIRLGIMATKNDWSATLGQAPDPNVPSFLLEMGE